MLRIVAICLAIATSASADDPGGPFGPAKVSKADIALAQGTVRAALLDPASANFGPVGAGQNPRGRVVICGLVNGKNAFGGYTGDQYFYGALSADRSTFFVNGIGGNSGFLCGAIGLRLQRAPML